MQVERHCCVTLCSCSVDVVARDLSIWQTLLLSPIFVLIPLNMYGQYYLVTHIPPGYPSPRALNRSPTPMPTDSERRWFDLDEKSVWKPERWGFRRRGAGARALTRDWAQSRQGLMLAHGDGNRDQHGQGEGRRLRRCRKCDGPKPEVCSRSATVEYLR